MTYMYNRHKLMVILCYSETHLNACQKNIKSPRTTLVVTQESMQKWHKISRNDSKNDIQIFYEPVHV